MISPDGKRVFVANSGQDTITVINALNRQVIGQVDLRKQPVQRCPTASATSSRAGWRSPSTTSSCYVTRFLSFTKAGGKQGDDDGKEGVVCRLDINTGRHRASAATSRPGDPARGAADRLRHRQPRRRRPRRRRPEPTIAFPNQLQSIVIRGNRAYLPNIAASPESPLQFQNSTEAFVNVIDGVGGGGRRSARP